MTLEGRREKRDTVIDISATPEEAQVLAKSIQMLRKNLTMDIMDPEKPLKRGSLSNKARISLGEAGQPLDPIMYLKVDGALERMATALQSGAISTEIAMEPNDLTRDRGDEDAAKRISSNMISVLNVLNNHLLKKDKGLGIISPAEVSNPIRPGDYQAEFVFDMTSLEDNLKGGASLEELLKKDQVIPEYGETWIPPAQRTILSGSSKKLMNQLVLVVVKDKENLSNSRSPEENLVIDKNGYKNIANGRIPIGVGIRGAQLDWFRQEGLRQAPKSIGELLGMGVVLSTALEYGIVGPRLATPPTYMTLVDPRDGEERRYYSYLVAGYNPSARRVSSAQSGVHEDAGVESLL